MKKLLCILLALMMLAALCACAKADGGTAATKGDAGTFKVGLAYTDITPNLNKYSVGLRGFGDPETRIAKDFLTYIYASCMAVQDADGQTAMLVSLDVCSLGNKVQTKVREAASKAVKLPIENVVISCTHQHSSPEPDTSDEWTEYLIAQVCEGAKKAIEDLTPATMEITSIKTENLNFVRHYKMKDGTYHGDNFGSDESGYEGHVSDADPMMQFVKFVREGKSTVLVTNFQGHPHLGSTPYYNSIHWDTVGEYRATVKETLGYDAIYFSGAGGNLKMKSNIEEENLTTDFREHGKMMARYAAQAEGSYTAVETGKVQALETNYTATIDHSNDHLYELAKQVQAAWKESGKASAGMAVAGKDSGISSVHHASAIISICENYTGETSVIEHLGAVSIGDVAFVAAPYEMFDQNGAYIKEKSPFKMTIIATIANGGFGYMPSEFTYTYGSYEVDTSKYVKGTAEAMADQFLTMLNQFHGE